MYLAETFTFAAEMSLSETSMAEKSGHQIKNTLTVITCVKMTVNFRGYRVLTLPKLSFSIDSEYIAFTTV